MPKKYEAIVLLPIDELGCRLWPWATDQFGYAQVRRNGKTHRVTRLLLSEQIGRTLLRHEYVCHRCDNPRCVSIEHLFVGSQMENLRDMRSKGRGVSGESAPWSKLTEAQVREIRRSGSKYGTGKRLALKFGVSRQLITDVRKGRAWKGVTASA